MSEPTDIAKMSARRKNVPTGLELAARIREGASATSLAAEYGVSKSTVSRAVNDSGLSSADGLSLMAERSEGVRLPVVGFGWFGYTEELAGAACVDHPLGPDAWFPSTVAERRVAGPAARAVCGGCPVRLTCLARALEEEAGDALRYGIRGGLDESERAELAEGMSA